MDLIVFKDKSRRYAAGIELNFCYGRTQSLGANKTQKS